MTERKWREWTQIHVNERKVKNEYPMNIFILSESSETLPKYFFMLSQPCDTLPEYFFMLSQPCDTLPKYFFMLSQPCDTFSAIYTIYNVWKKERGREDIRYLRVIIHS